jgi:hypothetical protein
MNTSLRAFVCAGLLTSFVAPITSAQDLQQRSPTFAMASASSSIAATSATSQTPPSAWYRHHSFERPHEVHV